MADKLFKGPFNEDMKLIDMQDGTFAERVEAHPPIKLLTDENGEFARLRVDVAQHMDAVLACPIHIRVAEDVSLAEDRLDAVPRGQVGAGT